MNILIVNDDRDETGILWATLLSQTQTLDVTLLVRPSQRPYFTNHVPEIVWHDRDAKPVTWHSRNVRVVYGLGEIDRHQPWHILLAVRTQAIENTLRKVIPKLEGNIRGLIVPTTGVAGEQKAQRHWTAGHEILSAIITSPYEIDPEFPYRTRVTEARGGVGLAYVSGEPIAKRLPTACGRQIHRALAGCQGIEVQTYASWREMKFTHALHHLPANAIPAILNEPDITKLYQDRELCRLELRIVAEACRLCRLLGLRLVDLPGYPRRRIHQLIQLAKLERWLGWTRLPARLFEHRIIPQIVAERHGQPPPLLTELRGGYRVSENIHFSLWELAKRGRLNNRIGRTLNRCFEQPAVWKEYTTHPERLLHEDR